jgi:hypothetical protein
MAGISQAYVVALERPVVNEATIGPTPTVDVVARIAFALGLDPVELLRSSLRSVGRHVLLVVDNESESPVSILRRVSGNGVQSWIMASPIAQSDPTVGSIRLRTRAAKSYRPESIAVSLRRELKRCAPAISGKRIGLVFNEMSEAIATVTNPMSIIEYEQSWPEVVNDAALSVHSTVEWNVCVYSFEAIRSLPDPQAATESLMNHHDTVLTAADDRLVSGLAARRAILNHIA